MKSKAMVCGILIILLLLTIRADASGVTKVEINGTGRISGCVRSAASNQPAKYVAVALYLSSDSSMIAGTITNNEGEFSLSMLSAENYFLEISGTGFKKKHIGINIKPVNPGINIGEVLLVPDARSRKKKKL